PIDFTEDVVAVDSVQANTGAFVNGNLQNGAYYVNGEEIAPGVLLGKTVIGVQPDGATVDNTYGGVKPATVTPKVLPVISLAATTDFAGTEGEAQVLVVSQLPKGDFFYDGDELADGDRITVESAEGEAFDTSMIVGYANGKNAPITVTAYKDGEVVTEYTEPGLYQVGVEFDVPL
ncbi:hypothetical protein, partial [Enorma phocaeensis]